MWDYCQVHTRGRKKPEEASEAGDWLLSGYRAMLSTSRQAIRRSLHRCQQHACMQGTCMGALHDERTTGAMRRWQRSNGADFVFYDPHPGFTDGTAEKEYYRLICDTFQHAMHIVVERGQRNICKVASWGSGCDLGHVARTVTLPL